MTTNPRRRTRALVTGFAAAIALVLATAAPAGATINITPPTFPATDYDNLDIVNISGSYPTGTLFITAAECKVDIPTIMPGEACHFDTAVGPLPVSGGTYLISDFVLHEGWEPDYDFTSGEPTEVTDSSTLCTNTGGDECYIAVSYYGAMGHISSEMTPVVF